MASFLSQGVVLMARTTMEGSACCPERYSVGATDGCSLGGPSRTLSLLSDMPPPIPAMGQVGNYAGNPRSTCGGIAYEGST
jgi:hypothetical protein